MKNSIDSLLNQFIKSPANIRIQTINKNFIQEQALAYMQGPNDEEEYQNIICCTQYDRRLDATVLERILLWKERHRRWKKNIDLNKFNTDYGPTINKIINKQIPEEEYIVQLIKLNGFGFPYASTLLHFIYPTQFPIIDARMVEVLYYYDYIKTMDTESQDTYRSFCSAVNKIKTNTGCSLHCIDRALWYFDLQIQDMINTFYIQLYQLIKPAERTKAGTTLAQNDLRKLIIDMIKWEIKNAENSPGIPSSTMNQTNDDTDCVPSQLISENIEETTASTYDKSTNYSWQDKVKKDFADTYINDPEEKDLFLKATDFRQWANYMAGFILTKGDMTKEFTPEDVRDILRNTAIPQYCVEAGKLLTADVRAKAPQLNQNLYPCLDKLDESKHKYIFIGFKEGIKRRQAYLNSNP